MKKKETPENQSITQHDTLKTFTLFLSASLGLEKNLIYCGVNRSTSNIGILKLIFYLYKLIHRELPDADRSDLHLQDHNTSQGF